MKVLIESIFRPAARFHAELGSSELAKKVLKSFNSRSIRKGFLKHKQFGCAVINLGEFEDYTAYNLTVKGKNSADYFARRCEKRGYSFREIDPNLFLEEIHTINTSAETRQGKAMESDYFVKRGAYPSDAENRWFGVFSTEGQLVAYLWTYRLQELAILNRILGHAGFVKDNVMYFLCLKTLEHYFSVPGVKYMMYDTFGSEKNGLYLFKKRIGFKPVTMKFTEN